MGKTLNQQIYGVQRFTVMCKTACCLILYQAGLMQSTSNLILSSNLSFHPLYGLVPSGFGLKFYMHVNSPTHSIYLPSYTILLLPLLTNFPHFCCSPFPASIYYPSHHGLKHPPILCFPYHQRLKFYSYLQA